jgi:hypothetical protein
MSANEAKPIDIPKKDDDDLYGGSSIFNSDLSDLEPTQTAPLKRNRLLLTKEVMKSLLKKQSK